MTATTDVCWCGLSRALHAQRVPETRDHEFRACPICDGSGKIYGHRCPACTPIRVAESATEGEPS